MSQQIWSFIDKSLEAGEAVTLMVVASSEGSSPGQAGFKMAVTASGVRCGTIGGGCMEIALVNEAQSLAEAGEAVVQFKNQVHKRDAETEAAEQSGLICSGRQVVISLTILPERRDEVASLLAASLDVEDEHCLSITGDGWSIEEDDGVEKPNLEGDEDDFVYKEPLRRPSIVYVVGSGHVGLAICQALKMCDFYVVCFDHRAELETFTGNSFADETILVHSYEDMEDHLIDSPRNIAIVATTSYKRDVEALAAISEVDLGFVTLMSSYAKKRQIYNDLREKHDVPPSFIRSIKSPMGLPIKAKTPAEIAISVAAALVDIRNGGYLGKSM